MWSSHHASLAVSTREGKTLEEGDYFLVQAWPEHDANEEPLLRRKVVQRGEHWEDGEVRREANRRIPAPVASPLYGTTLHLVLARPNRAAITNCSPPLGPH